MKRIRFHALTTIATIVMSGGLTSAIAENTAYIDMAKVFQTYYKTGQSESALRQQEDIYKDRAEEMAKDAEAVKKRRDELQERAVNVALSEDARAQGRMDAKAADELYSEKHAELRKFMDAKQKELREKYLVMRDDLVKELLAFIKDYSNKQGYDVVMDVSGLTKNFLPVVVCYPEEKDITGAVIAALNQGHESEAPAAAATTAPDAPATTE